MVSSPITAVADEEYISLQLLSNTSSVYLQGGCNWTSPWVHDDWVQFTLHDPLVCKPLTSSWNKLHLVNNSRNSSKYNFHLVLISGHINSLVEHFVLCWSFCVCISSLSSKLCMKKSWIRSQFPIFLYSVNLIPMSEDEIEVMQSFNETTTCVGFHDTFFISWWVVLLLCAATLSQLKLAAYSWLTISINNSLFVMSGFLIQHWMPIICLP